MLICWCCTQAQNIYSSVENELYDIYDTQQALIDEELQKLYETLGRIATLEQEISNFKQSLASLYQETLKKTA